MKKQTYTSPKETVAALITLYEAEAGRLREQFEQFANGEPMPGPARAYYPNLSVEIETST